jgi:hypothetical protein
VIRVYALFEDYKDPAYRAGARAILSNFLLENKRRPTPVALDTYIVHLKHWPQIVFNPRVRGGWKAILSRYHSTDAYRGLNEAINGDPLLAKYSSIHFLNTLLKKAEEEVEKEADSEKLEAGDPVSALEAVLDQKRDQGQSEAQKIVEEVVSALEEEAREIRRDIEAVETFSHIGIPVAELLEKPEEFRLRARNRIIVHLVRFLRRLGRESSGAKQAKTQTLLGGIPVGVKRMQRWSELVRLVPAEMLDEELFSYRLASKQVLVRESYGGIPDTVVYLDKSGSMGGSIEYVSAAGRESVPKISFAAASALALAQSLRRMGAKLVLKLFDVEVHEPIFDYGQLVEVLLRIRADSGTSITRVLEDAIQNHRDDKVVIVSDGIDEVDEGVVGAAKAIGLDVHVVLIRTHNPILERSFPCTYLDRARPEVLLEL